MVITCQKCQNRQKCGWLVISWSYSTHSTVVVIIIELLPVQMVCLFNKKKGTKLKIFLISSEKIYFFNPKHQQTARHVLNCEPTFLCVLYA